jgi:hypothetical protein
VEETKMSTSRALQVAAKLANIEENYTVILMSGANVFRFFKEEAIIIWLPKLMIRRRCDSI